MFQDNDFPLSPSSFRYYFTPYCSTAFALTNKNNKEHYPMFYLLNYEVLWVGVGDGGTDNKQENKAHKAWGWGYAVNRDGNRGWGRSAGRGDWGSTWSSKLTDSHRTQPPITVRAMLIKPDLQCLPAGWLKVGEDVEVFTNKSMIVKPSCLAILQSS